MNGFSISRSIKGGTIQDEKLPSILHPLPPNFKISPLLQQAAFENPIQANMSTVNMVKYFIYKEVIPPRKDDLRQLVYLAYQTARDRKLYPKAVLIRYAPNPDSKERHSYGSPVF